MKTKVLLILTAFAVTGVSHAQDASYMTDSQVDFCIRYSALAQAEVDAYRDGDAREVRAFQTAVLRDPQGQQMLAIGLGGWHLTTPAWQESIRNAAARHCGEAERAHVVFVP